MPFKLKTEYKMSKINKFVFSFGDARKKEVASFARCLLAYSV